MADRAGQRLQNNIRGIVRLSRHASDTLARYAAQRHAASRRKIVHQFYSQLAACAKSLFINIRGTHVEPGVLHPLLSSLCCESPHLESLLIHEYGWGTGDFYDLELPNLLGNLRFLPRAPKLWQLVAGSIPFDSLVDQSLSRLQVLKYSFVRLATDPTNPCAFPACARSCAHCPCHTKNDA